MTEENGFWFFMNFLDMNDRLYDTDDSLTTFDLPSNLVCSLGPPHTGPKKSTDKITW